jgi:hypothetical protein
LAGDGGWYQLFEQTLDPEKVIRQESSPNQRSDAIIRWVDYLSGLREHRLRHPENRDVAGAAADISGNGFDDALAIPVIGAEQIARQRNHQSRGTEAALGGAFVGESALNRTEAPAVESFNRNDMTSGDRAKMEQA